ncbi:MAG: hypothetical protein J0G94_16795 [Sphingomonadales bacterium]|nr:hypothetical protein [Sphingomonadales bacterium]
MIFSKRDGATCGSRNGSDSGNCASLEEMNPDRKTLFEFIGQNWTPAIAGEQGSEASP